MNKQTIEEIEILVSAKVEEAKKGLNKLIKDVKNVTSNVSSEFQKMNKVGGFEGIKKGLSQVKQSLSQTKQQVSSMSKSMTLEMQAYKQSIKSAEAEQEYLKTKIDELQGLLNKADQGFEVGDTMKIESDLEKLRSKFISLLQQEEKAKQKLAEFQQQESKGKNNGFIAKLKEKLKSLAPAFDKVKKKSSTFGKELGSSFAKGIKSIKKFAISLLGVRQMFTAVSRATSSYLSFDTQLSDSIQNCWNALGSLLAPILEYVVSLFSKLVSVVATFVKALTGVDLVARANAKALNNQAKATKNASNSAKSLSGIDDIDTLSSGSGGDSGSDTPQITIEDIEIAPLEKFLEKAKQILSKVFEPFKLAWENVGTGVFESMKSMVSSIGELGSSVMGSFMEVWTNGTGQTMIENALLGFQQIIDIVGNLGTALKTAWDSNNNGTNTIQHIANIFTNIQKFALSIGDSLKKWTMSETFQEALTTVFDVVEDIFGIAEDIADWVLDMYDKYFKPVIEDKLLPAIDEIVIAIGDIWNVVQPVVQHIIDVVKTRLEPIIQGFTGTIGAIIDVIRGIAQFVSGVFAGDWKKAWNGIKTILEGVFDGMKTAVKTPINFILAFVETFANGVIKGFNAFKKVLNKIKIDVPKWVEELTGMKTFGFNLKMSDEITLPRLATGNVAYEPTTAIFGEYAGARNNPEITSPVSIMKDSFRAVLNEFDFGGTRIDTLRIDVAGDNFYQGAVDYINTENSRKGVNIIKEG